MSVYFVFGKPGGGKSLYALTRLVDELRNTTRTVVTNLPIDAGALNAWFQSRGENVDLHRRLRIIDTEELSTWWRHRGRPADNDPGLAPWVDLPPQLGPRGETDFAANPGPCFYVLDEIHTHFGSRQWMQTGPAALWYLSQHRKLGDDVFLISQAPGQVDKQLRSLTQEWIHCKNLRKLKWGGVFRPPQRLLIRSFESEPSKQGGEPLLDMNIIRIPAPGLADCYATASGNGIAGAHNADKFEKTKKGLPWWVLLAVPVVLVVFLWNLESLIGAAVKRVSPGPAPQAPVAAPLPPPPPEAPPTPEPPAAAIAPPPLPPPAEEVIAWVKEGRRVRLWTSEQRTLVYPGDLVAFSPRTGAKLRDGTILQLR